MIITKKQLAEVDLTYAELAMRVGVSRERLIRHLSGSHTLTFEEQERVRKTYLLAKEHARTMDELIIQNGLEALKHAGAL